MSETTNKPAPATSPEAICLAEWSRGYYCAVASLIRKDGLSREATELFREGGGVEYADEQDKEEFRTYGLLTPNALDQRPGGKPKTL